MKNWTIGAILVSALVLMGCGDLAERFQADPGGTATGVVNDAGTFVGDVTSNPPIPGIPEWASWLIYAGASLTGIAGAYSRTNKRDRQKIADLERDAGVGRAIADAARVKITPTDDGGLDITPKAEA